MSTLDDARTLHQFISKPHTLYFILVRFFLNFGETEFWLRQTSVLSGILGIVAIYFAGKEVFGDRRVGLFSALFVALSRTQLSFSREARYYPVVFLLTALSLFLFARFLRKRNLLCLFLLPVVCFLNYCIHLTTLVFSGLLLAWIPLSLAATKQGRSMVKDGFIRVRDLIKPTSGGKKKKKGRKRNDDLLSNPIFRAIIVLVLLGVLFVGIVSSLSLMKVILNRMKQVRLFKAPAEGVTADFNFFFNRHFLFYGPVAYPGKLLSNYMIALFLLFSLVGYGRALIKRFIFGSFFLVCLLATFTLLFSVPIKQWYSSKYIFFIFPANAIAVMYGFVSIVDFLQKTATGKLKIKKEAAVAILYSLFLIPLLIQNYSLLRKYYRHMGINVKGAVRYAAEHMGPDDIIATYGLTGGPVRYYTNYYKIPPERFIHLDTESGDGTRSVQLLLKSSRSAGDIWYIFGWAYDIRPRLKEWVEKHFDLVLRHRTSHNEEEDVTLWKWKYGNRFLTGRNPIALEFDPVPLPEESPPRGEKGWLKADQDIYVRHEMEAVMNFAGEPEDLPSSCTFRVSLEGNVLGRIRKSPAASHEDLSLLCSLPEGGSNLVLTFQYEGDWAGKESPLKFEMKPAHPERIYFPAAAYDSSSPSYEIACVASRKNTYVLMPYNAFTAYNVTIPESGKYRFALKAKNDAPGPILYQIDVDDSPVGVIAFPHANNSWDINQFPIPLEKGDHTIAIYFITDSHAEPGKKAEDNDSYISFFYLDKIQEEKEFIPDHRLSIPPHSLVRIAKYKRGNSIELARGNQMGWRVMGDIKASMANMEIGGEKFRGLKAVVEHNSKGANIVSPTIRVKPGQYIYFSVKAGVRNLGNHSANVALLYLDDEMKLKNQQWVNAQGITRDVDEVKFICLKKIPMGCSNVAINLAVYRNSKRPYKSPGEIWFYDFLSDEELVGYQR